MPWDRRHHYTCNYDGVKKWSVSNGVIVGSNNQKSVVVRWGTAGEGVLALSCKSSNGACESTKNLNVAISENSGKQIIGRTAACAGQSEKYSVEPSEGETYQWFVVDAVIEPGNENHEIYIRKSSPGIALIGVSITKSGVARPDTSELAANFAPTPEKPVITIGSTTLASSSPMGNVWYLNGSILEYETTREITPVLAGYYSVSVAADYCFSEMSEGVYFDPFIGVSEIPGDWETVYPNPTSGIVYATGLDVLTSGFTMYLVNSLGSEFKQNYTMCGGAALLDLSDYESGVYFLKIVNETSGEQTINKIVLAR